MSQAWRAKTFFALKKLARSSPPLAMVLIWLCFRESRTNPGLFQ